MTNTSPETVRWLVAALVRHRTAFEENAERLGEPGRFLLYRKLLAAIDLDLDQLTSECPERIASHASCPTCEGSGRIAR